MFHYLRIHSSLLWSCTLLQSHWSGSIWSLSHWTLLLFTSRNCAWFDSDRTGFIPSSAGIKQNKDKMYHQFLSKQHTAIFSNAPDFSAQHDAEWKDLWGVCNHKIFSMLWYRSEFQVLMKKLDPPASSTSYYLHMFWWCTLYSELFGFWTSSSSPLKNEHNVLGTGRVPVFGWRLDRSQWSWVQ